MMENLRVFIVDDDAIYTEMLRHYLLLNPDFEVSVFSTGKDLLKSLYQKPSVILLDYNLPDVSGLEIIRKMKLTNPDVPVIIISGQKDVNTAIQILKEGAYDYLVKDAETKDRLWILLKNIKDRLALTNELDVLKEEVGKKYEYSNNIKGNSLFIKNLYTLIDKAARTNITVSLTGETGTGKELVAKAIHYNSPRAKKPFVAINVSAIPRELIESELFGHEKGSFTGAAVRKIGKFEEANKGTLFLDEISEMDFSLQAKLLRVLQERELTRVGGNEVVKIDTRLIVATNKNLAKSVQKGEFREDLYYRLLGLPIEMLPLRYRDSDILILAKYFLQDFCKENKMKLLHFTPEAQTKLTNYQYPGNIRELKSIVELSAVLANGVRINADDVVFSSFAEKNDFFLEEKTLDEYNREIIRHFLEKYNNNILLVSKKLNMGKSTIYRMLKNKEI